MVFFFGKLPNWEILLHGSGSLRGSVLETPLFYKMVKFSLQPAVLDSASLILTIFEANYVVLELVFGRVHSWCWAFPLFLSVNQLISWSLPSLSLTLCCYAPPPPSPLQANVVQAA